MRTFASILPAIAVTLLAATSVVADTSGITGEIPFTGFLQAGKRPANGMHDLQFFLYDAPTGGTQVGSVSSAFGVPIKKGQYSTTVDFGAGVWTGAPRFVEVRYRKGNATSYTVSQTRIQVLALPYAHTASHATTAGSITGTVNANHALIADYATEAGHASTADFADASQDATKADHADFATSATFAQDSASADAANVAGYAEAAGTAVNSVSSTHSLTSDFSSTASYALASAEAKNGFYPGTAALFADAIIPGFSSTGHSLQLPCLWTPIAPALVGRSQAGAAAANGKIYLIGGYDGDYSSANHELDPLTNTWTPKAGLAIPRICFKQVCAVGDAVYVLGESNLNTPFQKYIPSSDTWETLADVPVAAYNSAILGLGNHIYVLGGSGPSSNLLQIYDIAQNSWSSGSPLLEANGRASACELGGKIHLLGGTNASQHSVYDPVLNSWLLKQSLPSPRSGSASAVQHEGKIYITGGEEKSVAHHVHVYDPALDSWAFAGFSPAAIYDSSIVSDGIHIYQMVGATPWGANTTRCYRMQPAPTLHLLLKN